MTKLYQMDIAALVEGLDERRFSALELTDSYLANIRENEPRVGAYLSVDFHGARRAAKEADQRRMAGESYSPYDGIPCAIKDNILVSGMPMTCASRMLQNFTAPYDATAVARLRDAGFILLGKTNLDEFAMGSSCKTSALGNTRNPLDTARVAGGSSGGSAAAVAANEALFTLGSDTGGSIRLPAAYCGVVGIKPTYGLVSRYGAVGFAPSMDQIGPITRTVRDNAAVLSVIAGKDAYDFTSKTPPVPDLSAEIGREVKGLRLALPRELFDDLSPEVSASVSTAIAKLESLGVCLEEVSMPSLRYAFSTYCVLACAEASSTLARFDGVGCGYRPEDISDINEFFRKSRSAGFGREVKRRLIFGTFVLSQEHHAQYYDKAQAARRHLIADYARVFEKYDAILSATTLSVAPRAGEKIDPIRANRSDMLTLPANLAGLPALSLPCGKGEGGMPLGLHLVGPAFSEPLLYRIAAAVEESGVTV